MTMMRDKIVTQVVLSWGLLAQATTDEIERANFHWGDFILDSKSRGRLLGRTSRRTFPKGNHSFRFHFRAPRTHPRKVGKGETPSERVCGHVHWNYGHVNARARHTHSL